MTTTPTYAPNTRHATATAHVVADRDARKDDEQLRKQAWAALYPRLQGKFWRKRMGELDEFYRAGEKDHVRLENIRRGYTIATWDELALLDQIACEFEREEPPTQTV